MDKSKKTNCKKLKNWFGQKKTRKLIKTLKNKLKKQLMKRKALARSVSKICKSKSKSKGKGKGKK
jgi:hypothetical protein